MSVNVFEISRVAFMPNITYKSCYKRPLASGKPQTAVTRLQFRVAEISNFSKAFSSVHFYLAKIQNNTRIHIGIVRLQGSPEETRRLYEAWAPQSKRNKQNKMIFAD